jgi:hypothetical protein
MNDGYGLRWREAAGSEQRLVVKEKFFKTDRARSKFADRLSDKDGFIEVLAWCDPVTVH